MNITLAKQRIEYLLFAVVTFVPFILFPRRGNSDFFYAPKVYGLAAITLIFLFILLQNRKTLNSLIQSDSINLNLYVYLMLLVISLFFALDFNLAFYGRPGRVEGFCTLLIYFFLFIASRTVQIPNKKFIIGISISATILATYGILQFYRFDPFPRDNIRQDWKIVFSTFGNPNFFGSYLVLVIPIILHRFIKNHENTLGIIYSILLFALLCTQTRGTWIGAAVAIGAYLIIHRLFSINYKQDLRRIIYVLLITVLVLFIFNITADNIFLNEFTSISHDAKEMVNGNGQAGSGRAFIWKKVIELIKDRPFIGYGIENLQEPFSERFGQETVAIFSQVTNVDKAHNEYLNIAVTTGIPSLIVYLIFIVQILYRSFKKLSQNEIYFPFVAAVIGYLTQAFFNISVVSVAYIFWIFLGFIASYDFKQIEITEVSNEL